MIRYKSHIALIVAGLVLLAVGFIYKPTPHAKSQTTPADFTIVGQNQTDYPHGYATDIVGQKVGSNFYTYVANGESTSCKSFWIIDNTNPLQPKRDGTQCSGFAPQTVRVQGNYMFVAPSGGSSPYIWDITNRSNPTFIGYAAKPSGSGPVRTLEVVGTKLYVVFQGGDTTSGGLGIYDISQITNPVLRARVGLVLPSYESGLTATTTGVVYVSEGTTMYVIDATNPSSPSIARQITNSNGFGASIKVHNNVLAGANGKGMDLYDITTPTNPVFLAQYNSPNLLNGNMNAAGVSLTDSYACLTTFFGYSQNITHSSLEVVDITNQSNPILKGSLGDQPGEYRSVYCDGSNYAYLVSLTVGQYTIDLSDLTHPKIATHFNTAGEGHDVAINGNYVYEADYPGGLFVWDVSDKTNPKLLPFDFHSNANGDKEIYLFDGYLYYLTSGPLYIFDVKTNPTSPQLVKTLSPLINAISGVRNGNYFYVISGGPPGDARLFWVFDISNPANPVLLGSLSAPDIPGYELYRPIVKRINNKDYVYVVSGYHPSFAIPRLIGIDVSNPNSPQLVASIQMTDPQTLSDGPGNYFFARVGVLSTNKPKLVAYDATNPANPQPHDIWVDTNTDSYVGDVYSLEWNGKYLYMPWYEGARLGVFDVSNPLQARFINDVGIQGAYAYKERVKDGYVYHPILGGIAISKVPWDFSQQAVLRLTKSVDKSAAISGDTVTYTIAYTNTSSKDATNAIVKDSIPVGTTYVSNSASNGAIFSSNALQWIIGSIPANASGQVTFQVTVN